MSCLLPTSQASPTCLWSPRSPANTEQVRAWHRARSLLELISTSRRLVWLTAALQTLPSLAVLRLRELVIGSNVTAADVKAFEAEVRKRGMVLIQAELVSATRSKYSIQYDMRPLRRTLQWLILAVGEAP